MDVGIDASGRCDETQPVDRRRGRADEQIGVVDDVGISRASDADDHAILHSDIGLDDAENGIADDHVRDEQIQLALRGEAIVHHETCPQGLAPAAQHLVAVARLVALDERQEVRVT